MIRINAKKKVNVYRIECLLQMKVKEERSDLVWFLRKLGGWGLTNGEKKNMENYMEYLGLIRNGKLTQEGEKTFETGHVMIPEAGLYELLYVKDKIFGDCVINYQRKKPRDIIEGNIQEFLDYELYDEKIHKNLAGESKSNDEFWIKFQRQGRENPRIIRTGMLESKLEINHDQGNTRLIFSFDNNKIKVNKEKLLPQFRVEENISKWVKDWNFEVNAIELSYEEAKKNPATLNGFKKTMFLKGQPLYLGRIVDDGNWDIEVTVSVVPKKKSDADEWIYHLLLDYLTKNERYLSLSHLEEVEKKILDGTPILSKFANFFISGNNIMERMRKEKEIPEVYWKVTAVEDLMPTIEAMEVGL